METDKILQLPVAAVAEKIKSRELTSVELTRKMIGHARKVNEQTNAYISFREEEAMKEAQQADELITKGEYRGVYHGIPMGIKDNIYLRGEVTTMGSKIHRDFVPDEDAEVVDKLREAGAVIIGKHNLHEYAWGVTNDSPHFGPARNPWNPAKITGGSSGGSAAAIATDASFGCVGTDTAGSVRIPASCCGIAGLKPTQDAISRKGVFPLSHSLDHVGVMAKTVSEVSALFDIVASKTKPDGDGQNLFEAPKTEGWTIGINEDYYFHYLDDRVEELVRQAIDQLKEKGAKFVPVEIPTLEQVAFIGYNTILTESFGIHEENLKNRLEDFGPDIQGLYQHMGMPPKKDYEKAKKIAQRLRAEFRAVFLGVDALITPTLPCLPPDIGSPTVTINGQEEDLNDHIMRFMFPGNITGLPSLSVPCGMADGLPVGLQLIGAAHTESKILEIGKQVEVPL